METKEIKKTIRDGKAVLGIELGSTRIKAVLIGDDKSPIASGSFNWENRLENGIFTYRMSDVWEGISESYKKLSVDVKEKYDETLTNFAGIGVSAMMHGYLPFDKEGKQLAEFRTWRNTITEEAAKKLTELFKFNIPQRWSVAHLEQAILNKEESVKNIAFLTTLAGYVHWKLTGEKVIGIGDASGMFPIDSESNCYDEEMLAKFDKLNEKNGFAWKIRDILPKILLAGENAGKLTAEGAKLLDPSGKLEAGIPLCPPEGDAGTGMAATNSVAMRTGNISAGTSIFAMVVLEKKLKDFYPEIDMVTTPTGKPVAMVHCNNCTSDINAWAELFLDFAKEIGVECSMPKALDTLFYAAANGDPNCGGLYNINYFSGEPVTGLNSGRPLFVRTPDAKFSFANFARTQLYSAIATLKIGMDILTEKEKVKIDKLFGHGGFFKAKVVGQKLMAGALNTPVSVMATAGEGGPWGMALLAAFSVEKKPGETLEDYLKNTVFAGNAGTEIKPDLADVKGFADYIEKYKAVLSAEKAAVNSLK